jgi:hypothetical protein
VLEVVASAAKRLLDFFAGRNPVPISTSSSTKLAETPLLSQEDDHFDDISVRVLSAPVHAGFARHDVKGSHPITGATAAERQTKSQAQSKGPSRKIQRIQGRVRTRSVHAVVLHERQLPGVQVQ